MSGEPHLYFIFNPYTGLVKIGVAQNVEARRHGLECANGVALEVLAVMDRSGDAYEHALHEAFAEERQCGEWFVPCDDLLAVISGALHPGRLLAKRQLPILARRAVAEAVAEDALRAKQKRLMAAQQASAAAAAVKTRLGLPAGIAHGETVARRTALVRSRAAGAMHE